MHISSDRSDTGKLGEREREREGGGDRLTRGREGVEWRR